MTGVVEVGCGPPVPLWDPIAQAMDRAVRQQALLDGVATEMRLGLFREWLADGVTHVSALVPAVLDHGDGDRSTAMRLLRPSRDWPLVRRRRRTTRPAGQSARLATAFDQVTLGEAALCPDLYDVERIRMQVVGCTVELLLKHGGCTFATRGGTGVLRLPGLLPDAAAAACVGRPLEEVVDLPRLGGRGLVVGQVAVRGGHTLIGCPVERIPVSLWPDAFPF